MVAEAIAILRAVAEVAVVAEPLGPAIILSSVVKRSPQVEPAEMAGPAEIVLIPEAGPPTEIHLVIMGQAVSAAVVAVVVVAAEQLQLKRAAQFRQLPLAGPAEMGAMESQSSSGKIDY